MIGKEIVREYARELGLDLVGFAGVEPFLPTLPLLKEREGRGLYSPFAPQDLDRACSPLAVLPGARSIIVVGMAYYQGERPALEGYRGAISRAAWGRDYHHVVGERLGALKEFLVREIPSFEGLPFVDTGPLLDKEVAHRGGLGWFGNNTLLLTACGSWVFLGGILSNAPLTPDEAMAGKCRSCDRCRRACPTGALIEPGVLDYKRCLSYLTQQKGWFPREFRRALGRRLYGCDACQEACPENKTVSLTAQGDFLPREGLDQPDLLPLLSITNREFQNQLGRTSAGWRGRTVFQRNALLALGNLGDPALAREIKSCLQDSRPLIRGHAAWALGQLGGKSSRQILEDAHKRETDPVVREEIALVLGGKE